MADIEESEEDVQEVSAETSESTGNEIHDREIQSSKTDLSENDPFFYLKTDEFTSEKFKIEIMNLPKKFGFAQLKKRLNVTLGLKSHKIKNPQNNSAFVTFKCEEDKEDAIKKICGHLWKGNKLSAKNAKPSADPLFKKRKQEARTDGPKEKKVKLEAKVDDSPPHIRIKNSVTPYWNVSYEEQLTKKTKSIVDVLTSIAKRGDVRYLFSEARKKYDDMCCELLPIMPSPVQEKYRNKCEFSIGKNVDGRDNCVGFRYGLYKDGFTTVGDAGDVSILPDRVKSVAKAFEEFLSTSGYKSYHQGTHEGHWRQLTVRYTTTGELMLIPEFDIKDLPQTEIDREKMRLVDYFTQGDGKTQTVTSMFFTPFKSGEGQNNKIYEHLFGTKNIKEKMLDMMFQISPDAFFQVNTGAAELLYSKIGEWCKNESDAQTTILDICCGTGTIGLALAKNVTKVIGIEMCQQAIDDAKENAKMNGIKNVTYHCSRAEDAIVDIMRSLWTPNVVAIVDPPRAGLHKTVLRSLRVCRKLKKLIYVSCSPQSAKDNFIDLVRPPTKKLKGLPYKLVKAIPVDLFPMTPHCELMLLFEREAVVHQDSDSDFDMCPPTESAKPDEIQAKTDSSSRPTDSQSNSCTPTMTDQLKSELQVVSNNQDELQDINSEIHDTTKEDSEAKA